MKWNEEECRKLASKGAYVIVLDGFTENAQPNYVIRRVVKAFGLKSGRDSRYGVILDQPLSDGSDGVLHGFILGYNDGKNVNVSKLIRDAGNYYEWVTKKTKAIIVETVVRQLRGVKL